MTRAGGELRTGLISFPVVEHMHAYFSMRTKLILLATALLAASPAQAIQVFNSIHPTETSFTSSWQEDNSHAFVLDVSGIGVPHRETLYRERYVPGPYREEHNIEGAAIFSVGSLNVLNTHFGSPSGLWGVSFAWEVIWNNEQSELVVKNERLFGATFLDGSVVPITVTFDIRDPLGPFPRFVLGDPTRWEWDMHVVGTRVPDGGSTLGLLALAIGGLGFLRQRIC